MQGPHVALVRINRMIYFEEGTLFVDTFIGQVRKSIKKGKHRLSNIYLLRT